MEGVAVGAFAGTRRRIDGTRIEFESPDYLAPMAASVIRRGAQRADTRLKQLRKQRTLLEQARKAQQGRIAAELKATEEKLRKL